VRFGLDGTEYQIDVSAKNARRLRKRLAPLHRASPPGRSATAAGEADSGQRSHDIREWAKEPGVSI